MPTTAEMLEETAQIVKNKEIKELDEENLNNSRQFAKSMIENPNSLTTTKFAMNATLIKQHQKTAFQ